MKYITGRYITGIAGLIGLLSILSGCSGGGSTTVVFEEDGLELEFPDRLNADNFRLSAELPSKLKPVGELRDASDNPVVESIVLNDSRDAGGGTIWLPGADKVEAIKTFLTPGNGATLEIDWCFDVDSLQSSTSDESTATNCSGNQVLLGTSTYILTVNSDGDIGLMNPPVGEDRFKSNDSNDNGVGDIGELNSAISDPSALLNLAVGQSTDPMKDTILVPVVDAENCEVAKDNVALPQWSITKSLFIRLPTGSGGTDESIELPWAIFTVSGSPDEHDLCVLVDFSDLAGDTTESIEVTLRDEMDQPIQNVPGQLTKSVSWLTFPDMSPESIEIKINGIPENAQNLLYRAE